MPGIYIDNKVQHSYNLQTISNVSNVNITGYCRTRICILIFKFMSSGVGSVVDRVL